MSRSSGISVRQGWHHVAQTLRRTTLSLSDASETESPLSVCDAYAGAGSPMSTRAGIACSAAVQPRSARLRHARRVTPVAERRTLVALGVTEFQKSSFARLS